MQEFKNWSQLLDRLIECDYDLEENVKVNFEDKNYIYDNEEVNYYIKDYGNDVIEFLHHPTLELLLERKFLK
jgi:hypothetical protein